MKACIAGCKEKLMEFMGDTVLEDAGFVIILIFILLVKDINPA